MLLGGLDLSLEIDRREGGPDAWQPHVHVVVAGCTSEELRRALEGPSPATAEVERPLPVNRIADRARQVSSCFKGLHRRRGGGFERGGRGSV